MAGYIDVDRLVERIKASPAFPNMGMDGYFLRDVVLNLIEKQPKVNTTPKIEVFEEVDKFRTDLMNKFIDLCRGNDYNKLTLLKIGDVVDEIYDGRIAKLNMKYTGDKNDN